MDFHVAALRSGRLIVGTLLVSVPVRPIPSGLRDTNTRAPFQVADEMDDGAKIVIGAVPFVSPTRASVDDEIVALRTRYGPDTSTDGVSGVRSNEPEPELIRGFQNV